MTSVYPEVGAAVREQACATYRASHKRQREVPVRWSAHRRASSRISPSNISVKAVLAYDKQYVPIAQEWKDAHPDEELPDYFVTAMDLSAEDHIRVQAAIQRWVDSSISKTANCPHDFTVEETKELYELAFDLGCKGVTIYRDGSRDVQVLSTTDEKEKKQEKEVEPQLSSGAGGEDKAARLDDHGANAIIEGMASQDAPSAGTINDAADPTASTTTTATNTVSKKTLDKAYKNRPQVLRGATYKVNTPFGMAYITINDLSGTPGRNFPECRQSWLGRVRHGGSAGPRLLAIPPLR